MTRPTFRSYLAALLDYSELSYNSKWIIKAAVRQLQGTGKIESRLRAELKSLLTQLLMDAARRERDARDELIFPDHLDLENHEDRDGQN